MTTKRSCCMHFSCFSSASSDEKGQDPTSAETLPGAPKRTEAPISGSFNVVSMKHEIEHEIEHVDVNLNVSGAHQCDKAPVFESLNLLRKSEGKNVNVNLNGPGAPQCNEALSSGFSNVSIKYEGEDVDVNLNVSEAPWCDEDPSSSSSSGATKSDVINTILHKDINTILHKDIEEIYGEKMDVNLDNLMEHICELLKLREEEMLRNKNSSIPSNFPWPDNPGFKKLNAILSWGTDLKNFKELLSSALDFASKLKDVISGPVTTILKDTGQVSVVTTGLLVVAYTLERFDYLSTNKEKCRTLIKEMSYFATLVKRFKESPRGTQDVTQDATALIVEGAILCCTQIDRLPWKSFFLTSKNKAELRDISQKLNVKYLQINIQIGFRVLTAMECKGRSPLSKKYPTHAVGIEKSMTEVLDLLEIENDQNAVMVILHGFGGMGKTTLADWVNSEVGGCRSYKVRLFEDIESTGVIEKLQKQILENLMEPGQPIPNFSTYEDGRPELGQRLEKVQAFIYIDNVLNGDALKKLLPQDMSRAKKVRLLLTARDENLKNAYPRRCRESIRWRAFRIKKD